MSFEYIVEEDKVKKLNDSDKEEIAKLIANRYDTYDNARQKNLDMAKEVMDDIYFKKPTVIGIKNDKEKWKTEAKIRKTYMFYQTLKAFIWKNVYSSVSSMFDVAGENQEANGLSNRQKANLVDKLEKMNIQNTLDSIIDYAIIYSDLISFSAWKKKEKEIRRPIEQLIAENAQNPDKLAVLLQAQAENKHYYVDTVSVYDSPYVYAVNPANFVFDVTQKENWDECPKIYKSFKTPENIINNKYYTISKDDKEAIKELAKESNEDVLSNQEDKDLQNKSVNGRTVEVLEHWGDLKLKDGTLLHNWHAVVVGGKYLVQFEKNQRIINPFTYHSLIEDPDTKRGISLLYCVLEHSKLQDELVSRTINMQALNENPPKVAPKGMFKEDKTVLYPGKVEEFGDNLSPNAKFEQITFNDSVFLNDITFLSDTMAEVSGIFPNMAGAEEARAKTATEISTKTEGQMTRLSMIIDNINQNLIVPLIKNIAELIANFQFGDEELYLNKNNQEQIITITDQIRQADYKYTYSDRSMTVERMNKADKTITAIEKFAQYMPVNVQEVFSWYMEQNGVENPERFIAQQAQMPQPIQEQLLQDPYIQELVAGYEQAEQEVNQQ